MQIFSGLVEKWEPHGPAVPCGGAGNARSPYARLQDTPSIRSAHQAFRESIPNFGPMLELGTCKTKHQALESFDSSGLLDSSHGILRISGTP